ncbi:MAG: zinc-dependent peptidase [Gammaproteobacteria bacterium]
MTAYWVFVAAAAVVIVALIAQPLWRARQRRRRMGGEFPAHWRELLERKLPLYARMPAALKPRLHGLVNAFIAEKRFVGCAGQVVDDEVRLLIAAQACLLVLNRELGFFDELESILVYPSSFLVDEEYADTTGVVTSARHELLGRAWDAHQIILSWEDVVEDSAAEHPDQNVVLHEFAHQLDQAGGSGDGAPSLRSPTRYARWSAVLQSAYETLLEQIERGATPFMDEYGASDPAEFFAVATETFFIEPRHLERAQPALYGELEAFYGVDPASW